MTGRILFLASMLALVACKREQREVRLDPPALDALGQVALMPNGIGGAPPEVLPALGRPYENNAYQLSQGKRLYEWFNCTGCHANGGGNVGPALMDGWWRYGPDMQSIFASIHDGRPHGMPPFQDKLTAEQIWQLAGYVQTIGMYSTKTAAPTRNDEMQSRPSESRGPAGADISPPSR
jgi:cytochrome c oxidase cbb3-type subunit 3